MVVQSNACITLAMFKAQNWNFVGCWPETVAVGRGGSDPDESSGKASKSRIAVPDFDRRHGSKKHVDVVHWARKKTINWSAHCVASQLGEGVLGHWVLAEPWQAAADLFRGRSTADKLPISGRLYKRQPMSGKSFEVAPIFTQRGEGKPATKMPGNR